MATRLRFESANFASVLPIRTAISSPSQPRCRRSEEHTSELQSQSNLVCRLLLEKKNAYGDGSVIEKVQRIVTVLQQPVSGIYTSVVVRAGAPMNAQRYRVAALKAMIAACMHIIA